MGKLSVESQVLLIGQSGLRRWFGTRFRRGRQRFVFFARSLGTLPFRLQGHGSYSNKYTRLVTNPTITSLPLFRGGRKTSGTSLHLVTCPSRRHHVTLKVPESAWTRSSQLLPLILIATPFILIRSYSHSRNAIL